MAHDPLRGQMSLSQRFSKASEKLQVFRLRFLTVAKFQLRICNDEITLWLGATTTTVLNVTM